MQNQDNQTYNKYTTISAELKALSLEAVVAKNRSDNYLEGSTAARAPLVLNVGHSIAGEIFCFNH